MQHNNTDGRCSRGRGTTIQARLKSDMNKSRFLPDRHAAFDFEVTACYRYEGMSSTATVSGERQEASLTSLEET